MSTKFLKQNSELIEKSKLEILRNSYASNEP